MATQAINDKQALELYNQHFPADRPKKSALTKALQDGRGEEAQKLIDARGASGFTEVETWQIKVFKNLDFNDQEFRLLPPRTQNLVYRTANCFNKTDLVGRLNGVRKFTADAPIKSPSLLSPYMDIATDKQTVESWMKDLRKQGRLLTEEEFLKGSSRMYKWRKKGEDLGRILGRDHLERLISELNLKYIKVPEKVAVVTSGKTEVSIDIREYADDLITMMSHSVELPLPDDYDSDTEFDKILAFTEAHPPIADINIHAKDIRAVKRKITPEEVDEFITIIAAAHFTDLNLGNIIVAADGIYFIDTEFKSFSGTLHWNNMGRFMDLLPPNYSAEFEQRINAEIKNKKPVQTTLSYADTKAYGMDKKILKNGTLDEKFIERVVRMREARKAGRLVGTHTERTLSFPIQDILAAK